MNILVIGGGIFGTVVSLVLSENFFNKVTLIEETDDILNKASKHNHNRLHLGFHYPRSIETAKQSIEGLVSFFINFKEAINTNFPKYYLIEKSGKTTAKEFINFCDEMNISYTEKWPDVQLNRENLTLSLLTEEPGFDYDTVKKIIKEKLKKSKVNLIFNKSISNFDDFLNYDIIINCTYANINNVNRLLNTDLLKLKYQDVVIPIVNMNMSKKGLTIMDGPFCSIMPFGFHKNQYLLYHVKYSVLDQQIGFNYTDNKNIFNYNVFLNEFLKYYPFLQLSEYINCYRTVRALPINENDERLTDYFITESNNKKIITILSGKISTCWKIAYELKRILK